SIALVFSTVRCRPHRCLARKESSQSQGIITDSDYATSFRTDTKKVIALAESDPFPQYPWTMRSDLDTSLKEAITKAFIDLKDEKVLASFKADGFAPIDDKAYDVVRELGKVLNLDLSQ
ncbi:PhnD/SsuA/transferrin family substrate-binding protein, partial [Hoeflea sp. EC-HK425]|uniref:PhnD/SsuA/transferrin family substrate-binding protein n=1 Tax=Hoeflea sp. EC-HK425 TaxID=2038388 RepID=UPI00125FD000